MLTETGIVTWRIRSRWSEEWFFVVFFEIACFTIQAVGIVKWQGSRLEPGFETHQMNSEPFVIRVPTGTIGFFVVQIRLACRTSRSQALRFGVSDKQTARGWCYRAHRAKHDLQCTCRGACSACASGPLTLHRDETIGMRTLKK